MQAKLAKGRTFTKPQERLNRIVEILEDDMTCAFCESWMYDEICKIMEWGDYSPEEIQRGDGKEDE